MRNVLIIGGTSRIAEMTARRFATMGARLCLLARDRERLAAVAADLRIRGASDVCEVPFDARHPESFARAIADAWQALEQVDVVLVAYGVLVDQDQCIADRDKLRAVMEVNAISTMEVSEIAVEKLLHQGSGTLAVIASVAGLRGRESNYVYGASKAAVIAHCSGLRQRVAKSGVQVLTILPGPVDTPMTASHSKSALWSSADAVAGDIVSAIKRGKSVLYTPWYWRHIMSVVKHLPEGVFLKFGPR